MDTEAPDILIAGGGPVGAALALALEGSGHTVVLAEARSAASSGARNAAGGAARSAARWPAQVISVARRSGTRSSGVFTSRI